MFYKVIRQFVNIDGSFLRPGDTINCDEKRAFQLLKNGLIGHTADQKHFQTPKNLNIVENAEQKPVKRHYRKRVKTDE